MELANKYILITGATSGIGYVAAKELAKEGATIIFNTREFTRGKEKQAELIRESGNESIYVFKGDFSSLSEVRTFAQEIHQQFDRLDILINNAGVFMPTRKLSQDGYELSMAVNHLSHFLLTHLLMPLLKNAPKARIIHTSSEAHRGNRIHFDDLHFSKAYNGLKAYGQSKLANILFTRMLAQRLMGTEITTYAFHPGVINTDIIREGNIFFKWMFQLFGKTPEQGAAPILYLAKEDSIEELSGSYFNHLALKTPTIEALDDEVGRQLWQTSERLCNMRDELKLE